MDNLKLGVEWDINEAQLQASMRATRREITTSTQSIEQMEQKMSQSFKNMAIAAGGFFSVQAAQNFVSEMTKVRGEFQQIEVAYTTMLRSQTAATRLMDESVELAAKTPFGLLDVANSTKQLIAYGISAKDVTKTLEMLGNVAS